MLEDVDGIDAIDRRDATASVRPPLPRHLQVEVTSACNLGCRMCLVSYRPRVNKTDGALPIELFRRLVDETPGLERLTLQGLGEPLLSPHLFEMVAYAKDRGIRVGFNTNATLLHRRVADRLVDVGLDWLHASLDGATAETFEGIRAGARFDVVARNIRGLAAAKQAAAAERPWIRVVFVAMRRNVDELPELVRLLAQWGVNELRVQNLSHSFSDTDPAGSYAEIRAFAETEALWNDDLDRVAAAFEQAKHAADAAGIELRLPSIIPAEASRGQSGCSWPWDGSYVTSTGVVQPCCMVMGDDRVAMGTVGLADFAEVWHGEAYQEFRAALLTDDPPAVCRGCSMYRGRF